MVHRFLIFAVFAALLALSCGGDIEGEPPQPSPDPPSSSTVSPKPTIPTTTASTSPHPEPTPPPPPTTTPTSPPTTKPTSPPTTKPTSPPTTTPTSPPTTTQTSPPTTKPTSPPTTKPTSPPTTKPTSPPPPPPTTSHPTTTPKPSPKPPLKPDTGNWNVTDKSKNVTCILIDMAVQLNVSYIAKDNNTHYGIINVPKNATATGTCGEVSQVIILTWFEKNETGTELILNFMKNNVTNRFMISMINITLNPNQTAFHDVKDDKSLINVFSNKTEFATPLQKSYRCDKEQTFDLMRNATNITIAKMEVSHVHLEAFHEKENRDFGAEENCETSSSPDVVPIAVGCALVGLVAIVLIAYLVGRRRSQARGYLSM